MANNQLANPAVNGIVINARDISVAAAYQARTKATLHSGHQTNVADLPGRIARRLDLPEGECEVIELGAAVHDILATVDLPWHVIDAMVSHRPYRPALGMDAALAELQRGRGTQYDAAVVDAALAVLGPAPSSVGLTGFEPATP